MNIELDAIDPSLQKMNVIAFDAFDVHDDDDHKDDRNDGDDGCMVLHIVLSEEETIATKLAMASVKDWASSLIHMKLGAVVTNVVNQYMFHAMENGWEVPQTKVGILRMALERYAANGT
jgi:hypothetical protein